MTNYNQMKPLDVGAPVLIPQGNMADIPGTYGWMAKEYWTKKNGKKFKSSTTNHPDFKCGYGGRTAPYFTDIDITCTIP